PFDVAADQSARDERRDQQKGHEITQYLVRDHLKGEHFVAERIERLEVTAERAHRLFDHAHSHPKLVFGAVVGVFERNRFRVIDRAQILKVDFGRDHKIVNHVVGQPRVTGPPYGVQTAADADERPHMTLTTLQEFFVPPVRTAPFADGRRRRVYVNELARDTAHLRVGEAADDLAYRVRLVHRGRVGEDQDFTRRGFDGAVLRDSLAEPVRLPVQDHALH